MLRGYPHTHTLRQRPAPPSTHPPIRPSSACVDKPGCLDKQACVGKARRAGAGGTSEPEVPRIRLKFQ